MFCILNWVVAGNMYSHNVHSQVIYRIYLLNNNMQNYNILCAIYTYNRSQQRFIQYPEIFNSSTWLTILTIVIFHLKIVPQTQPRLPSKAQITASRSLFSSANHLTQKITSPRGGVWNPAGVLTFLCFVLILEFICSVCLSHIISLNNCFSDQKSTINTFHPGFHHSQVLL